MEERKNGWAVLGIFGSGAGTAVMDHDQAQANGQTGRGGEADGQIGSIQIPSAHKAGPSHPANSLRTRAHATIFSHPPCANQTNREIAESTVCARGDCAGYMRVLETEGATQDNGES